MAHQNYGNIQLCTKMQLGLSVNDAGYDALLREKGKLQISVCYRIPLLQKLPAPSLKTTCAHICVYLCERKRRKAARPPG